MDSNTIVSMDSAAKRNVFFDPSLWSLLLSNGITMFFAISQHWNASELMLIYWSQSVIIGIFNFFRILRLKNFSTEGFLINGRHVSPTEKTKRKTAYFFLMHYGLFHASYLVFLQKTIFASHDASLKAVDYKYVAWITALFFINHAFSYFYNKENSNEKQNIGKVMFFPYIRIIPMHIAIIFGTMAGASLPLFLVLKTAADAITHIIQHGGFRKKIIL